MLPVRYDWIFARHCAESGAFSPSRRLSHAERFKPFTGVPVVVSVTLNFMFASSAALTLVAFGTCASTVNSIATPCSTSFCGVVAGCSFFVVLAGSCARVTTALNSRMGRIVILRAQRRIVSGFIFASVHLSLLLVIGWLAIVEQTLCPQSETPRMKGSGPRNTGLSQCEA